MDQLIYWIWLSLACTPGSTTFSNLISKFADAEEIYDATDRQIRSAIDPKISDCSSLYNKDLERAESIYEFCTTKGVGIVTYNDAGYPKMLKRISNPPVLLYYRGTIPDWDRSFRCAMVGTRNLSSYGRRNAFAMAYDFAYVGGTVVSGMAKGIDGVALAAALEAGGTTIAVLGSGIDVCYPKEHLTLAREIVKKGVIFTEYPPGTRPERRNFPTRNRIISGMSEATLVIEAGESSGALITGRRALDQGRHVFAVPARVDNNDSIGTNILIKEGAKVCMDAVDIMEGFLPPTVPGVFDVQKLATLERPRDFMEILYKYRVVSNVPDDPIFIPSGSKRRATIDKDLPTPSKERVEHAKEMENLPLDQKEEPKPRKKKKRHDEVPFAAEQLVIYKRIPATGDCAIESLVDDEFDLKEVMNLLLKLELSRFIVMLPGDRVKRNLK